ncbi:DUF4402 domain-containing protein [Rhizorhabdus sp.]|uniref:DUF4402 domain-containing protein n=1 Tax=Rhizorhabdus sp. TaxID=1968843 RepID=UPI0019847316|nr:DUF4402 domain-containing protein [Rhizorhabdus sp.]MBD3761044.1 DUF4402 domain-containing protein [Rhizorhabdus sp.]
MASLATGAVPLWAQQNATTNGGVTIVEPGNAVTDQSMVIGAVSLPLMTNIGASAGAVSLPPPTGAAALQNVRIGTESVERQVSQVISRGDARQASFTIIGDRDQIISIAVPQTVSLLRVSGDGEVEFSTVNSLVGGTGGTRLLATANGSGALAFDVGGEIQPTASAVAGDYAGVLIVAVQYN